MTQQDALMLEKGRVPAEIAVLALHDFLSESERSLDLDLSVLSSKSGVPYDTLETMYLKPDRTAYVEFDVADNILCATRLWDRWRSRYGQYYENVNLALRQCAHPDCSVWFEILHTAQGGRKQYCSRECATSAKRGNRRVKHFKGKAEKRGHSKKCRNGHERTPENTIYLKSGKIRCRICNNERSNQGYHRRRALAAA